jgi:DNA (cytosine-5)-methyltransferase 1
MATGGINALVKRGIPYEFWAVNHWYRAVQTMMINHPNVHVFEADLSSARPRDIVTGGRLNHLHASPSCTHHSRACGGRPRNDQLRAQPNWVLDWLDDIKVERLSIENVPEFITWGPLDENGKPIKAQKGTLFDLWVKSIEARNYKVEWNIVNCADFGDATTRKRFFLKAVKKGCGEIRWPTPTYSKDGSTGLKWRGVKECLDFSDTGTSIFNRKKPLAAATMERIAVGAAKYWGIDIKPFIVRMNRHCYAESIDDPCSTLTTSGAHHMLCTPIVMSHWSNGGCQDGSLPLGSQTTKDHFSLVTALVLGQQGGATCRPVDEPCPTLACAGAVRAVLPQFSDGRIVDIRIRMLRPDELARVHSFPEDYIITGNRCEKVKQIGNSVPVRTAEAMMAADLEVA